MRFKDLGIDIKDKEIFNKNDEGKPLTGLTLEKGNLSDEDLVFALYNIIKNTTNKSFIMYIKRTDKHENDLLKFMDEGYYEVDKNDRAEMINSLIEIAPHDMIVGLVENDIEDYGDFNFIRIR